MDNLKFWNSLEEHFDKPKYSYESILKEEPLLMYSKISKTFYFYQLFFISMLLTAILYVYFKFESVEKSIEIQLYVFSFICSVVCSIVFFKRNVLKFYYSYLKKPLSKIFFYEKEFILKASSEIKILPFSSIVKIIETKKFVFIKINDVLPPLIVDKSNLENTDFSFMKKISRYKKVDI